MVKVYTGSVLNARTLSPEQREAQRRELEWLETDLIRRRKRLAYWTMRKGHAEAMPDIPEDLRQKTDYFHARAQDLVNSGERLRAYLLIDLIEQPEHQAAYHYAH